MKRLLSTLVLSLALGLAGGVGTASATDLLSPSNGTAGPSQTADQSNNGSNSINQGSQANPVVINASPNVALANGDGKTPCGSCGGGTVYQNSGSNVTTSASNDNNAAQTNNQANALGQSQTTDQTGCCSKDGKSGGAEQEGTQSNKGTNETNQSAEANPVVINASPNVAIGNSGDVYQNSGSKVDTSASNKNRSAQTNNQSNSAGQSQTVGRNGCCSKDGKSGGPEQSADQSNQGTNTIKQDAQANPVIVNASPNVAILNGGDVHQNSGSDVTTSASNDNRSTQTNNQSNALGQSQTVGQSGCCSKDGKVGRAEQEASQSNEGTNTITQDAGANPVIVNASPNVAIANGHKDGCNPCDGGGGEVFQNSGSRVNTSASNSNWASQTNNQSNALGQVQTVGGSDGCCFTKDGKPGGVEQSADQSNTGTNTINQSAEAEPFVLNTSPNIAAWNSGAVFQNSGSDVRTTASNSNWARQTNNQSNGLGQVQTVGGSDGCCFTKDGKPGGVEQSADQSNTGTNTIDQSSEANPFVLNASPNVAFGNGGGVFQNSGSNVNTSASNANTATQTNNQSNTLGQTQTTGQGGGCESDCHPCDSHCSPCEPRRPRECEPEECEPKRCEPEECEPCDS